MNEGYYIFYHVAMVASLLLSLTVVFFVLQRHQAPGAKSMVLLASATFLWTLGYLLETHGGTLERHTLFNNIGYLGSMTVPVAWFFFALHYTNQNLVITRAMRIPFLVVPLIITVLIWTNGWHGLMWYDTYLTKSYEFTVEVKTYGPFFWVAITHNYLLVVGGAVMLVRHLLIGSSLYRGQALSLLIAVCVPLIWNVIYVFNLVPLPRKDLTPVAFAISAIAITFGLMRYQLLTTVPFARKFLIQQLSEGVIVLDNQKRLLEINAAALDKFGIDKEVTGSLLSDIPGLKAIQETINIDDSAYAELTLPTEEGNFVYEIKAVPMHNNRGREVGRLIILHDITERHRLQERLISQDRLASIGEFTSGIAHELNNPLAVIMGHSELLNSRKDIDTEMADDLKIIQHEVDRAADIVGKLLTFARKHPDKKQSVNLHDVILRTIELRRYEQESRNIVTETELVDDLPPVLGNESQLQQVIINIIINAEFFMSEYRNGGKLVIRTEQHGESVHMSFTDDGPGIPKEYLNKIFNPFFTTKDVGQGTGLGLSISHGIVREHGGRIWAESEEGQGTTLVVELPIYVGN